MRLLDGLRRHSVIVEDTGEIDSIERFAPQDATTNPSLLYQAAQQAQYSHLVGDALRHAQRQSGTLTQRAGAFIDRLFINFGCEILRRIPGRVSTEVDAGLSFDGEGTIAQARHLVALYEKNGIDRERVLIKIASTWEGIRAAERLEREQIHCNLTLLFSLVQAAACADAGITLVSPFVGRIYDWHKKDRGVSDIPPEEDPGVGSVVRIYNYMKKFDYRTEVMGASFRKTEQILLLAGCDLLTISPELLEKLEETDGEVSRRLSLETAQSDEQGKLRLDEKSFRWMLNQDAMATEKLAEGIRRFYADSRKLEHYAQAELSRPGNV